MRVRPPEKVTCSHRQPKRISAKCLSIRLHSPQEDDSQSPPWCELAPTARTGVEARPLTTRGRPSRVKLAAQLQHMHRSTITRGCERPGSRRSNPSILVASGPQVTLRRRGDRPARGGLRTGAAEPSTRRLRRISKGQSRRLVATTKHLRSLKLGDASPRFSILETRKPSAWADSLATVNRSSSELLFSAEDGHR